MNCVKHGRRLVDAAGGRASRVDFLRALDLFDTDLVLEVATLDLHIFVVLSILNCLLGLFGILN